MPQPETPKTPAMNGDLAGQGIGGGAKPPSGKTGAHHLIATNSHLVKDQLIQPEKLAPLKQGGQLDTTHLAVINRLKLSMNLASSSKPPTALAMYKGNPFAGPSIG